jgi:hypothetical protein
MEMRHVGLVGRWGLGVGVGEFCVGLSERFSLSLSRAHSLGSGGSPLESVDLRAHSLQALHLRFFRYLQHTHPPLSAVSMNVSVWVCVCARARDGWMRTLCSLTPFLAFM